MTGVAYDAPIAGRAAELAMLGDRMVARSGRNVDYGQADVINGRLAATLARRFCLNHPCTMAGTGKPPRLNVTPTPCRHRNHRRDMEHLALVLDALGQEVTSVATEEDYSTNTSYATFNESEARDWSGDD